MIKFFGLSCPSIKSDNALLLGDKAFNQPELSPMNHDAN